MKATRTIRLRIDGYLKLQLTVAAEEGELVRGQGIVINA